MRTLISLILGGMLLNQSLLAGSKPKEGATRPGSEETSQTMEVVKDYPNAWQEQKMEDTHQKDQRGRPLHGFEKDPTP